MFDRENSNLNNSIISSTTEDSSELNKLKRQNQQLQVNYAKQQQKIEELKQLNTRFDQEHD